MTDYYSFFTNSLVVILNCALAIATFVLGYFFTDLLKWLKSKVNIIVPNWFDFEAVVILLVIVTSPFLLFYFIYGK